MSVCVGERERERKVHGFLSVKDLSRVARDGFSGKGPFFHRGDTISTGYTLVSSDVTRGGLLYQRGCRCQCCWVDLGASKMDEILA